MLRITLLLGTICLAASTSHAATCRWVGPDNGVWNNASNWSTKSVPKLGDSVVIDAKKKVSVPADAVIANLTVGEGAEVKNGATLTVTGKTASSGLFTGTGALDVPAGALATITVSPSGVSVAKSLNSAVKFASINNRGTLTATIGRGSRVSFASLSNTGSVQITSSGSATFKGIKNMGALSINSSGSLALGTIDNAKGASLKVSSTRLAGRQIRSTSSDDSLAIHFDDLINRPGGDVTLSSTSDGSYFDGDSISNGGEMQISGAQILLESDVSNAKGAKLVLDSGATLSSSDNSPLQLSNAGDLIKSAGSDATLQADVVNSGHVVVESGTLHVQVPQGEGCEQVSGVTSVEGGVFSIEDSQGLSSDGTFNLRGGIVNGIGTFAGNVVNSGGHFKPGHSPGTITINGSYFQTANGILDMELGGTTPGSGYDQLIVNGTANLNGTLSVIRWDNFVPKDGDVYTLITYYSKSGNFSDFDDATPVEGIVYDTTLTPTDLELNCYDLSKDTTSPTVSITSPTSGGAAKSLTSASGKANDTNGLSKVTCRLYRYANSVTGVAAGYWAGGSAWTSSAGTTNERTASGTTSWSFAFPTLVAGRYSLRATATDIAGNTTPSPTISFWVDPNAPSSLTISSPANGSTISSLGQIGGTVSDAADGSGITIVKFQLKRTSDGAFWNGSAWTSTAYSFGTTLSGTNWSRSSSISASLTNGKYSLISTATDKAGNTKTVTSNFTVSGSSS